MKVEKHINNKIDSYTKEGEFKYTNMGGIYNNLFVGREVKEIYNDLVQFHGDHTLWFKISDFWFDTPINIDPIYEVY